MSDIRLLEVYGEDFRSFEEPFRVQFPATGSLLIRGINKDSGDSSGSGKSSLVLALAQVFGGCPFPGTELATWGRDKYKVGARVLVNDVVHRVERKSSGLLFEKGDVEKNSVVSTAMGRSADAELTKLFGLPPDLRAAVTYRAQGTKSVFLNLPDAKIKELLTTVLNLEPYQRAAEAAKEAVKGLRREVDAAAAKYDHCLAEAQDAERRLAEVPADDGADPAEQLAAAEEALAETQGKLDELQAKEDDFRAKASKALKAALEKLGPPPVGDWEDDVVAERRAEEEAGERLQKALQEENKREGALREQRTKLEAQLSATRPQKDHLPALRDKLRELEEEKALLESAVCPTCEREWVAEEALKKIEKFDSDIESVRGRIDHEQGVQARVLQLQEQIRSLPKFERDPQVTELHEAHSVAEDALEAATRAAKKKSQENQILHQGKQYEARNRVEGQLEKLLAGVRTARSTLIEERLRLSNDVKYLREDAEERAARVALRQERAAAVDRAHKNLGNAGLALGEVKTKLDAELDFLALVGREGFLGAYPDDALAEIAAETNEVLGHVANVRHVAFSYVTERENGAGNLERKIVPMVTIRGETRPFESGLSGGMQSAVGLAVDLGWRAVIRRRASSYPNWMVLDEAFEGLGNESKKTCLEMLQTYGNDSLFLVIDHSSEMQSYFSDVVEIESEGGRSKIISK